MSSDDLHPRNLEAEQGVLGSILLDPECYTDVAPLLKAQDFFRDTHGTIFRRLGDLVCQGKGIDSITLEAELRRHGELESVGGLDTIFDLMARVPHAANVRYYAAIVAASARQRDLIQALEINLKRARSNNFSMEELVALTEQDVAGIGATGTVERAVDMKGAVDRFQEAVAEQERTGFLGYETDLVDLDDMLCGIRSPDLIILAGRPSMGKTSLVGYLAEAISYRTPVYFASLEMGTLSLVQRFLSSRTGIDGRKIRNNRLNDEERQAVLDAGEALSGLPIILDDTGDRTVASLTSAVRRWKARRNVGLVIVDYLQLLSPGESSGRESRNDQVARMSRGLKALAKDLDVPVIVLSQMNRRVETSKDRRPTMADLRDSGAIEQDADAVLLIHRPDYYKADDRPGLTELIVAKNRNGPTGDVNLRFIKNVGRWEPWTERYTFAEAGRRRGIGDYQ